MMSVGEKKKSPILNFLVDIAKPICYYIHI